MTSLFQRKTMERYNAKQQFIIAGYWLPVFVYCGLIFYLSSLQASEIPAPSLFQFIGDKNIHAIEYAILAVLCYRAFRRAAGPWAARYALVLSVIAAVAYGLTDEIHQVFVPTRDPSFLDLWADLIGASIGAGLVHASSRFSLRSTPLNSKR